MVSFQGSLILSLCGLIASLYLCINDLMLLHCKWSLLSARNVLHYSYTVSGTSKFLPFLFVCVILLRKSIVLL